MKKLINSALILLALTFVLSACEKKNGEGEGEMNSKNIFQTPEEAIVKAKNDLIQVLETDKEIDLGIDVEKLRQAEQAKSVEYSDVDFEKLLKTENVQSLSEISLSPKAVVAPFVFQNNFVAVVEVSKELSEWKISGLGNKPITEDLNAAGIPNSRDAQVTIYEVPNLEIFIYGVNMNGTETYHLNYGEFSLRDSVSGQQFYPLLRENSIRFQREYGDILKKEKLLK
jgi:hypothetical protein